jgi:predicted amidohydrolase
MRGNVEFYATMCRQALDSGARLVVLPERAIHWGLAQPGHALDLAVTIDDPLLDPFRDLTRERDACLVVGLWERERDAVFNSAVIIGPGGHIVGTYRKTHLAVAGESENGMSPGSELPVFDTDVGRIGCAICVDSSTMESTRLLGLNGAEIIAMPINGDNRADRRGMGTPIFNEGRWKAIMRTRAMDNHLTMIVARNQGLGSCIVDPRGEVLAWNEGDQDVIYAEFDVRPDDRAWNGGSLRDIQWMQRRPHIYGGLAKEQVAPLEGRRPS